MQPAHPLPEPACFGVPVMRPAGQGDYPVVMEHHIAELPFYSFWRDSSIDSAQSLIDGQAAVFLHDWNAFCRRFVRTGRHRGQTGHTDHPPPDGQYNPSNTACASDVRRLVDGTRVVPLADWEAFCRRLVLTGR